MNTESFRFRTRANNVAWPGAMSTGSPIACAMRGVADGVGVTDAGTAGANGALVPDQLPLEPGRRQPITALREMMQDGLSFSDIHSSHHPGRFF